MFKQITFIIAAIIFGTQLQAQNIKAVVGTELSNYNLISVDNQFSSVPSIGLNIGIQAEGKISSNFTLESGLLFRQRTIQVKTNEPGSSLLKFSSTEQMLSIPVRLNYYIKVNDKNQLKFFGGFNQNLIVNSKNKLLYDNETSESNVNINERIENKEPVSFYNELSFGFGWIRGRHELNLIYNTDLDYSIRTISGTQDLLGQQGLQLQYGFRF